MERMSSKLKRILRTLSRLSWTQCPAALNYKDGLAAFLKGCSDPSLVGDYLGSNRLFTSN